EASLKLNKERKEPVLFVVVCARSTFTQRLEKLADEMGAAKYIKLLGFVPDYELGVLYRNSLGFLFPSLSEGFGLPGLEAILAGTVTLASNIPVFKETYGDSVIYFDPLSSSSLKAAMNEVVLLTPEARTSLIKKAQKFARRYSWDKMARTTLKVYEASLSLRSGQ
ncbi:glycosyltransferase, partial [Candidatus Woesebacteria bacterium]|nr:glycosyltransferase [Candidatus Woesebacteria bacterium]